MHLINSPIKTFGLEVIPVANKPILILNEGVIEEDSKISLNPLINRSRLIDNDGSENYLSNYNHRIINFI